MYIKDLSGSKIGALTVIKPIGSKQTKYKCFQWECKCACGNIVERTTSVLWEATKNGVFSTCGCLHRMIEGKETSIVGNTIAQIKVLSYDLATKLYDCVNKKGKKVKFSAKQISIRIWRYNKNFDKIKQRNDFLLSVGCSNESEYNQKSIRLHHILFLMKQRCYDKDCWAYHHYGGRGIFVYNEWLEDSTNFVIWSLQNGYAYNLQIDRIDNNKSYTPDNCRWVDRLTNMNNTRRNKFIEYNNRTQTLAQWCRELHIDYKRTHYLIKYKEYTLQQCVQYFQSKNTGE